MVQRFNTEPRCQQEWGWLFALYLFLGGSAGGLFLIYKLLDLSRVLTLVAVATMFIAGLVVLFELGSPLRLWRAFSRPGTSWVSRGILAVALFLVTAVLSVASAFPVLSGLGVVDAGAAFGWIATLCALIITLYPGFILYTSRGIPFWKTLIVPALFVCYATLGACGIVLLFPLLAADHLEQVMTLAGGLILMDLILGAAYLMTMNRAGGAGKESVRVLTKGSLRWPFWSGVVFVGLAGPLVTITLLPLARPLIGISILIGGLLFRYCILKAGVYAPVALASLDIGARGFSRFSPTLIQEYGGDSGIRRNGSAPFQSWSMRD